MLPRIPRRPVPPYLAEPPWVSYARHCSFLRGTVAGFSLALAILIAVLIIA